MNDEIIKIELNDELDLHYFHPKDAKILINDFIESALKKNKSVIRIVHGKGRSVMKKITINELEKNKFIKGFKDDSNNWGATIVYLK